MNKTVIFSLAFVLIFLPGLCFAQDDVIRIETSLVNVPVIVSDRDGRKIPGLQKKDFNLFHDGERQEIEFFADEAAPLNIAILIDTSRSTEPILAKIKMAAKEFLKNLKDGDNAAIITFDNNVEILSGLESDRKKLRIAIEKAEIGDRYGTLLNDAIAEAIEKTIAKANGRKAVVLLTDGKDFGSETTRQMLLYKMEESEAPIYPVFYETGLFSLNSSRRVIRFPGGRFPERRGPGRRAQRNARDNRNASEFLERLAEITGGRFFAAKNSNLDEAFTQIREELVRQYIIGFYPPENASAQETHRIKVKVDRPNVAVRAKSSYRIKNP